MTGKNVKFSTLIFKSVGFPWWHNGLESALSARDTGLISGPGGFHRLRSNWAHRPQLLSPRPRAWAPSTRRETTTVRSPSTARKSSPRSPQLENACMQHWRPSTAKNKYTFLKCILHFVWMFYINWKITEAGELFSVPVLMRVLQRHRTNDGIDILTGWTNDWLVY